MTKQGAGQAGVGQRWTAPQRWTLAAAVLGSGMAFIDGTVVNVALSALQRDFGADVGSAQWVINGYTLMLAALILTGGALGDLYGRRRVFGLGVLIFAAASGLCGLAPTLGTLIAARVLQGIGGALLIPGSLAMIDAVFGDALRGRAVGLWSAATSVVTVLGPVLGGVLIDLGSWRWVFLINLPLALLVLWCLRGVPETRAAGEGARRPDLPGAVLATAGLGALTYGLIQAGERGLGGSSLLIAGLGVAGLAAFVLWEARAPHPMLPLGLFRSAGFAGTNALTFLLYGALGAALFFLPLNLIGVQGYSGTAAGTALLPMSLLLAGLSGVFGSLADRTGPRPLLTVGPILAGVGLAWLGFLGVGRPYLTGVLPGVLVLGLGMAITVAPLTSAVLGSVSADYAGTASGVNNAVSRAAGLLAVALFTLLMLGSFRGSLSAQLAGTSLPLTARAQMLGQSGRLAQVPVPDGLSDAQAAEGRQAVRLAFADGFRQVCLWCGMLAALGGLVGFLSLRGAGRGRQGGGAGENLHEPRGEEIRAGQAAPGRR
ncbi:MFS transporter (plasmid) [Deinococcus aetherius]|uniref:MFS transporter n=1 Tax=Deinococcus aetherius TaxID=200252 RepID=A0ABM8AIQ2_9DEIO|nr:DHA2 family efflux MFS transporter permease subunit [Deinococcus aetherius]BDP43693.1 MFS transporter [Deinococcus aetherius]